MTSFNAGATNNNTGSSTDFWGTILGGVKDTFGQWIGYQQSKKPTQTNYIPTSYGVRYDAFGDPVNKKPDYQKWGLWIGVAGLVVAVGAFAIGNK